MRDGEYTLAYGSSAYTFGPSDLPAVNMSAPDMGIPSIQTDDTERPRSDGVAFGVDFRGGRAITFDLGVFGATEVETRQRLAALATAWRGDEVRSSTGAVATLTYRLAGRERVVYGRPRRFAPNDELASEGAISVLCDFSTVDDVAYASTQSAHSLTIAGPLGGGLIAPLASPLLTTASSDRSIVLAVGGELPTWPVMTIHGPIVNPKITIVNRWSLTLATTLAYDQAVTIDTRPWSRTVLRNGGGSLAGQLTRASVRLSRATLPPGSHEVALSGVDGTGTASLNIAWRDAYSI